MFRVFFLFRIYILLLCLESLRAFASCFLLGLYPLAPSHQVVVARFVLFFSAALQQCTSSVLFFRARHTQACSERGGWVHKG